MSTTHDLDPVLSPRSVAVIGASRNPDSIGYAVLDNLIRNNFQGPVFPINPKADSIHSLKCYPSIADVPQEVDLAVIVVPKPFVMDIVNECLDSKVKGFVIITAGFTETGKEGAAAEKELLKALRAKGVRMIGPNCMGILNTDPDVQLNATFAPVPAKKGSLAFASQSGALGLAILTEAKRLGIGFTQFISMGNKADVSGNDLLDYWEKDNDTKVIALYLESIGNPARFTELSKRVGRKKPIIMVKSGRTAAGARAASSHTGAMAGSDATISALTEQCGIVRVRTLHELFDVAKAFTRCPLPKGNRLAIMTNAGGPAIMTTDASVTMGLDIVDLSEETTKTLGSFLPPEASLRNPVDMIASATPDKYEKTLRAIMRDENVDMVIVIHVTPTAIHPEAVMEAVGKVAKEYPEKPLVTVMMTNDEFHGWVQARKDLPPVYDFPESAAQAMASLYQYAKWRNKPVDDVFPEFEVDDDTVSTLIAESADGYMHQEAAWKVLEAYGIPVAPWRVGSSIEETVEHSKTLGYPVVVKAEAEGLVHKSDVGAVALDLRSPNEVEEALGNMTKSLEKAGVKPSGFFIQEFAKKGVEVIYGVTVQPKLGPLVMFGLGGKYVEVFKDVRFGLSPLSRQDAQDMIRGIRAHSMLEGVRGDDPADETMLADVLMRIGQLARRHPSIVELDINPFLAAPRPEHCRALDVRIRVKK